MEAYRGIKLLLDVSQKVKHTPSIESKALLKENGIPVRHAVRDYLKQLIEYTKQVLQRQIAIDAAQMNLQFVLTVPAVWSEKAKQMTLEAAVAAGADFKNISLVSEPEAAALYTLRAIQPNTLAVCHPESHTISGADRRDQRRLYRLRCRGRYCDKFYLGYWLGPALTV